MARVWVKGSAQSRTGLSSMLWVLWGLGGSSVRGWHICFEDVSGDGEMPP